MESVGRFGFLDNGLRDGAEWIYITGAMDNGGLVFQRLNCGDRLIVGAGLSNLWV